MKTNLVLKRDVEAGWARLTQAEQEVARRAAAGHSNREIAEELFLSVRTVENHLHCVCTKLAISGRNELAAALATARSSTEPEAFRVRVPKDVRKTL